MKLTGVIVVAFGLVAEAEAAQGDYAMYENSVRAAAIRLREHRAECIVPQRNETPWTCNARVTAEFRKALALAKASFTGTRADWDEAVKVIAEVDARVKLLDATTAK
jgi:hypothetical protein